MPKYKSKVEQVISIKTFENIVNNAENLRDQSLISILYWSGLRKAEITGDKERMYYIYSKEAHRLSKIGELPKNWNHYPELRVEKIRPEIEGILAEDIELIEDELHITAKALKRGERLKPLILSVNLSNVDLIEKQWKLTSYHSKVWDMSTWQAWDIVKKASDGRLYPHFFRLNRASRIVDDYEITIKDIKDWFGWKSSVTLGKYLAKSGRGIRKISDSMKRRKI